MVPPIRAVGANEVLVGAAHAEPSKARLKATELATCAVELKRVFMCRFLRGRVTLSGLPK